MLIVALLLLLALIIIGGSGLTYYYIAIYQPAAAATAKAEHALTALARDVQATATASSPQYIYTQATKGAPSYSETLNNSSSSLWMTLKQPGGDCGFAGGAYHIRVLVQNYSFYCYAAGTESADIAFQIQATILQGEDAGIMFRAHGPTLQAYFFYISNSGTYGLTVIYNSHDFKILAYSRSKAINQGLNRPNLLTVIAKGSTIYLYANKHYLTQVTDSTSGQGFIGVVAATGAVAPTDVAYNNAQIWYL